MARVNSTGKESSSNFSPSNGTGLAVRTALKDILESLRTVNSAAGDPSGTANIAAYQMHINSSNNLLKIRNAANSAYITLGDVSQANFGFLSASGGTLTGVLKLQSGNTPAAPKLSFSGDGDTGFYRRAANQIGLSCAGTEQMFFNINGLNLKLQNEVRYWDSNSTQYIGFKAPSNISSNFTLTLPATDSPVNGYALVSNGSGTLSWAEASGGGGAVGGGSDEIFWENGQTITTNYTITNGKNAGSFGPIAIQSGVTVTVGSGETWSVV